MKNIIGFLLFGLMIFSFSQAQAGNLFKEIFSITDAANGQEGPQANTYPDPQLNDSSDISEAVVGSDDGDSLVELGAGRSYKPYSTAIGDGKISH